MSFSSQSLSRAILHIDADSFFASCEVAKDPKLKGKSVITGLERGIASSLSYEAKARGVKRGMSLREIRSICPDAIFLPSDYESYSLYSLRMFNIVRRFTPDVEEYSIDECFADLTGLRRPLKMSYEKMAEKIKESLDEELGMTFSLGLAPTKVLAKLGSNWNKPSGLTVISQTDINRYLAQTKLNKVWGIGPQTTALLNKYGITTALEFTQRDSTWIQAKLSKPYYEIWQELRGDLVYQVTKEKKSSYCSISKTKTFTPASNDSSYIFSQLSKNTENACIKLRRYHLATKKFFFFLKTQDFKYQGFECKLNRLSDNPIEIIQMIDEYFAKIFSPSQIFRATGIVLMDLQPNTLKQADLFNQYIKAEKISKIFTSVDQMAKSYGKHSLFLGSSFLAMTGNQHHNSRQTPSDRKTNLFKGETERKRLALPFLGEVK